MARERLPAEGDELERELQAELAAAEPPRLLRSVQTELLTSGAGLAGAGGAVAAAAVAISGQTGTLLLVAGGILAFFALLTVAAQWPMVAELGRAGPPPAAPYEPPRASAARLLRVGLLAIAAPLALFWAFGGTAAAAAGGAIAAGGGAGRLVTGLRVRRWERRSGTRALGTGGAWWGGGELFTGEPEPWRREAA